MSCSSAEGLYPEGEASRGAIIFKHRCAECHTVDKVSLSLHSVYLYTQSLSTRVDARFRVEKKERVDGRVRRQQLWNLAVECKHFVVITGEG